MINHELDALLQGALDDTLTPDDHRRLAQMISESREARDRAAELKQLATLIDSLGPADAPAGLVDDVLEQVSHHSQVVRPLTFQRGVAVNKRILFGLAAAAAVILALITYYSYPPVTVGTEATIGAAQRAQAPQINAQDVKLGDTSAQDVLQTETFDAILKDESVRTMLQDANMRQFLQSAELRKALQDDNIMKALSDPAMAKKLSDPSLKVALSNPELMKKYSDANMRSLLLNKAFSDALRDDNFRVWMSRNGGAALASPALHRALLDRGFAAALRDPKFAAAMRGVRG